MAIATKFRALDAISALNKLEKQIRGLEKEINFLMKQLNDKSFNVDYGTSTMRNLAKHIVSEMQPLFKPIKLAVDALENKRAFTNFISIVEFLENLENELIVREKLFQNAWKGKGNWAELVKDFERYCVKTTSDIDDIKNTVETLGAVFTAATKKAA